MLIDDINDNLDMVIVHKLVANPSWHTHTFASTMQDVGEVVLADNRKKDRGGKRQVMR